MSELAGIDDYARMLETRLLAAPSRSQAEVGLRLELAWTLADRYDSEWGLESDRDGVIENAECALAGLVRDYEHRADVLALAARGRVLRWYDRGDPADREAAIGHLRGLVTMSRGDDAPDLPETLGTLAELLTERAENTEEGAGRTSDLEAGIAYAKRAAELSGENPSEQVRFALGFALAARFDDFCCDAQDPGALEVAAARSDRDLAIEQLTALYDGLDETDPAAPVVAERLAVLCHDRYGDCWDDAPEPSSADLGRAVGLLIWTADRADLSPVAMLTLGLALADRYFADADPADHEAAAGWLHRVLPEATQPFAASIHLSLGDLAYERAYADPPPEFPRVELEAALTHFGAARDGGSLVVRGRASGMQALTQIALIEGDGSDEELDRMVESGQLAWELLPPGAELRAYSGFVLALALHDRLPRSASGRDLEEQEISRAVEILIEVEPDLRDDADLRGLVYAMLGLLLAGRGQIRGDAADVRAAGPWLLRAIPELTDDPGSAVVRRNVALGLMVCGVFLSGPELQHAIALLRSLLAEPESSEVTWLRVALGSVLGERAQQDPELLDEAIELLRRASSDLPEGDPDRLIVLGNLAGTLEQRFSRSSDLEDLEAAAHYRGLIDSYLEQHPEAADALEAGGNALAILRSGRGQADIVRGVFAEDRKLIERGTADIQAALATLPEAHPFRARMRADLGMGLLARGALFADGDRLPMVAEAATAIMAGIEDLPPGHPRRPLALLRAVGIAVMQGGTLREPAVLEKGVEHAELALAEPDLSVDLRVRFASSRAGLLMMLARLTGNPARLREAVTGFEQVLNDLSARADPNVRANILRGMSMALRDAGESARAREAGRRALASYSAVVLLQSGSAHALERAQSVHTTVEQVVRWSLEDGEPAEAIAALELGRGLVLHAATVAADVPGMLADAGHEALAEEWRTATDSLEPPLWRQAQRAEDLLAAPAETVMPVPSGLRGRALEALADTPVGDHLRNPPSVAEIAAALAGTDADALVYLLPPAAGAPAHGIVVTAGGAVDALPFPLFTSELAEALDVHLADQRALHTISGHTPPDLAANGQTALDEPTGGAPADREAAALWRWRRSLDLLCNWAWPAVMRPLLRFVADRPDRPDRSDRDGPPRLVLVPVGPLSAVPWQAARRRSRRAGPPVYACAEAVISYASSGRQLVDVSRRGVLDLHESPLIVGDPTGTLFYALAEGAELHDRYYPDACYLGLPSERADGPGVPSEVLARLGTVDRPGASMIHIGCHARVFADRPGDSFLKLAEGQRLKIDRLLRTAHGRAAGAPGALVSLAACMSDLTAAHHDEALTLATAFIAAGAATVVGARWEIPDVTAPLLMIIYHGQLADGIAPRDALRQAQLWMLDPDRQVPDGLPEVLRQVVEEDGLDDVPSLNDVVSWAAFTHQGR